VSSKNGDFVLIPDTNHPDTKITDMKKIKITQVKSGIDRSERQKLTLKALGLNKMNATKEVEATPQILGMVKKVNHLVRVEKIA
jgi:large subunit ribosomal protein L30